MDASNIGRYFTLLSGRLEAILVIVGIFLIPFSYHTKSYFILRSLLSITALILCYWVIIMINDYFDRDIDRINLSKLNNRPTLDNIKPRTFWLINISIIILSLVLFIGRLDLAIIILIYLVLGCLYSIPKIRLSALPWISPFFLTLCYVFFPYNLALHQQHLQWSLGDGYLLVALYFLVLARVALKDIRDVEGDLSCGKLTVANKYGAKAAILLSFISLGISVSVLFNNDIFSSLFRLFLIIFVVLASFIYYKLSKYSTWNEQSRLILFMARLNIYCLIIININLFLNN